MNRGFAPRTVSARTVSTWIGMMCATLPLIATAAGDAPMGGSGMDMQTRELSPQQIARNAYNDGVRSVKKAAGYEEDAAEATRDDKKAKAQERTRKQYEKAREQFLLAVNKVPTMHEAWNYVGYTSRKLGEADKALAAYDEALRLKPNYSPAIEYRGVAYLLANRLDDAKNAYMALFRDDRKLAAQLMAEMQSWIEARKLDTKGVNSEQLDAFSQWVAERTTIAQQTASLAIDAPSIRWQ